MLNAIDISNANFLLGILVFGTKIFSFGILVFDTKKLFKASCVCQSLPKQAAFGFFF